MKEDYQPTDHDFWWCSVILVMESRLIDWLGKVIVGSVYWVMSVYYVFFVESAESEDTMEKTFCLSVFPSVHIILKISEWSLNKFSIVEGLYWNLSNLILVHISSTCVLLYTELKLDFLNILKNDATHRIGTWYKV